MRQATAGVTEALLDSAKKEFLKYGFYDASLRRISADSGVSTNSIYTRFKDKSGLFSAVVGPVADGLMDMYIKFIGAAADSGNVDKAEASGEQGTEQVLKYIYDNFDIFRLIFCCSAGTEYENYFNGLVEIEEKHYRIFVHQYSTVETPINDFFIHVMCSAGWRYIYEIVTHKLEYNEAVELMSHIQIFNQAGWRAVLEGK